MEFTTVAAFLETISVMFNDVGVDVLDLKNRLDSTKLNPEDSGGYLDVMVNGRFKGSRYILEVQFTVKALLAMSRKIEIVLLMEPLKLGKADYALKQF